MFGSKLGPCGPSSLGGVEFTVFNLGGMVICTAIKGTNQTLLELPFRFSPESVQLTSNSLTSIFPRGRKYRNLNPQEKEER